MRIQFLKTATLHALSMRAASFVSGEEQRKLGRSDKNSKLIMAVTVTCNLSNGQLLQTTRLCSVLSRCVLYFAWIRILHFVHQVVWTKEWPRHSHIRISTAVWIYTTSQQFALRGVRWKTNIHLTASLSPTVTLVIQSPWLCNVGARCHLLQAG